MRHTTLSFKWLITIKMYLLYCFLFRVCIHVEVIFLDKKFPSPHFGSKAFAYVCEILWSVLIVNLSVPYKILLLP